MMNSVLCHTAVEGSKVAGTRENRSGRWAGSEIDVQYRQSESDGESHRTSFTMDPMEFFSYRSRDKHTFTLHNVINENIITI